MRGDDNQQEALAICASVPNPAAYCTMPSWALTVRCPTSWTTPQRAAARKAETRGLAETSRKNGREVSI